LWTPLLRTVALSPGVAPVVEGDRAVHVDAAAGRRVDYLPHRRTAVRVAAAIVAALVPGVCDAPVLWEGAGARGHYSWTLGPARPSGSDKAEGGTDHPQPERQGPKRPSSHRNLLLSVAPWLPVPPRAAVIGLRLILVQLPGGLFGNLPFVRGNAHRQPGEERGTFQPDQQERRCPLVTHLETRAIEMTEARQDRHLVTPPLVSVIPVWIVNDPGVNRLRP